MRRRHSWLAWLLGFAPLAVPAVGYGLGPGPDTPEGSGEPSASTPAPDETKSDGPDEDLEGVDDIEEVDLADLLGMDLDEQLGTTEAVSRTDESILRAPASLTTLDAERIRHMGATTFPDLLRSVPGVQVARNSAGNYLVSLRAANGLTGNNVVVMLDGMPLNSPVDSSIDWDLIPIAVSDVERVEIVRGPVSTIYGADAYTGVINIVSRETTLSRHSAGVRGAGGTDLQLGAIGLGSANYIHTGERITFKWFGTGRYDDTLNTRDAFHHPAANQVGSTAMLNVATSDRSQFRVELGGGWSKRGSLDQLVLESHPTERGLAFGSIGWGIRELPSVLDTIDVWGRSRAQFIRTDEAQFSGFSYADTNAIRSEVGLDMGFDLHRIVHARIGGQGTLDYVDAPYLHPNVSGTPRGGAAFHGTLSVYPTKTLDLSISGRGDLPPVIGRIEGSFRTSLVYHRDRWAVRLALASAFRSPSYVEAGGQFRDPATDLILLEGDPNLKAPRHHSIELGATVAPINAVTIRPTVHVSAYSGLMVADFEPLVRKTYTSETGGRWLIGGELEVDWAILDELTLSSSASFLQFLVYDEAVVPLVGVPEQNSTWTGAMRLFGTTTNHRYGYGLGGVVASPRTFTTRAGIPPAIIDTEVPYTGHIDGRFEFQPALKVPIWLNASSQAGLMPQISDSPFPLGAQLGAVFMLGLEWRRE